MLSTSVHFLVGNNLNGGPIEIGNMGLQRYHEPASNRSNASFSRPSAVNLQHHNFHHMSPPIQGMRGHNINILPQAPAASFRVPTANASQSTMNPSQDGLDIGLRHLGSVQPTGLRMYRPHREGVVPETTLRHRNLPQLRVLPTDVRPHLHFHFCNFFFLILYYEWLSFVHDDIIGETKILFC
jgi:E3 ubiquitin-protein ligase Arkadia/E3 ubiquitin-protein ligase RNF38/44